MDQNIPKLSPVAIRTAIKTAVRKPIRVAMKTLRSAVVACVAVSMVVLPLPAMASPISLPAITQAAADFTNPDPRVEQMFRTSLLDTLAHASSEPDGTIYVDSGDIYGEWLRDSSAQVRPYLYFAKANPAVAAFIRGVIARQVQYIQVDPYANSFEEDNSADPVHDRKFELDSLAYPVILAWMYWKETGDASVFTPDFAKAMGIILDTMQAEQNHPKNSKYVHFALTNNGQGPDVGYTGMIWTGFRPSDDNCQYNYLIPAEMMAVVALGDLSEIETTVYHDSTQAVRAKTMRQQVHDGIQKYGIVYDAKFGWVYAYEVDGLGHFNLQDEASVPSLLSAPYWGYVKASDPVYVNTRNMILSASNPNYFTGKVASGIGSAHTGKNVVWPLSLIMQGLTATTADERKLVLNELLNSDPGDHLLHQSFDPNNPQTFTRKDFGWANALFCEFILADFEKLPPLPMPDMSGLNFSVPTQSLSQNPSQTSSQVTSQAPSQTPSQNPSQTTNQTAVQTSK